MTVILAFVAIFLGFALLAFGLKGRKGRCSVEEDCDYGCDSEEQCIKGDKDSSNKDGVQDKG
jgi:hypothetical protein